MFPRTVAAAIAATIMVFGFTAGAHAAPGDACAGANVTPANASMRPAAASAVLCLVNAERARNGLAPVTASSPLTKAASLHSADMVRRKYFSHVTPNGLDQRKRVARTGYLRGSRCPSLGETIAWGSSVYGSPAELVKDLMNSPPHRKIILDKRYRDIGVGLALGAPMAGFGDFGSTLSLNFGRR
ncbi:MAG: hypothetical protein QOE31_733 [Solirubrobacteraceae bacterium]|jgi:uncharacterized protein YkwD|nr:hypothetical protein [Solirubrobacteraceae bacterium]